MKLMFYRKFLDRIVKHSDHRGTFYSLFGLTLCDTKRPVPVPRTWELKPFKGEFSYVFGDTKTWSVWGEPVTTYSIPEYIRTLHIRSINGREVCYTYVIYNLIKTTRRKRQFWKGVSTAMTEVRVIGEGIDERYCYTGALSNNKIRSRVPESRRAAHELKRILNRES